MADWVPWDYNAEKGLRRWVKKDENGDVIMRREYTNVGDFVEHSKSLQSSGHDGYNKARDMRKVGHIPDFLRQKIIDEEGIDILKPEHKDRLLRVLQDPDLKYLVRANDSKLAMVNGIIR